MAESHAHREWRGILKEGDHMKDLKLDMILYKNRKVS